MTKSEMKNKYATVAVINTASELLKKRVKFEDMNKYELYCTVVRYNILLLEAVKEGFLKDKQIDIMFA